MSTKSVRTNHSRCVDMKRRFPSCQLGPVSCTAGENRSPRLKDAETAVVVEMSRVDRGTRRYREVHRRRCLQAAGDNRDRHRRASRRCCRSSNSSSGPLRSGGLLRSMGCSANLDPGVSNRPLVRPIRRERSRSDRPSPLRSLEQQRCAAALCTRPPATTGCPPLSEESVSLGTRHSLPRRNVGPPWPKCTHSWAMDLRARSQPVFFRLLLDS